MRITRRKFVTGSALVGAGFYFASRTFGLGTPDPSVTLAIYDGSADVGQAFAAQARAADLPALDIAADRDAFWQSVRSGLEFAPGHRLIGVTGWDDRVFLASHLAERRMRLRREVRLDCCGLDPRADHRHDLLQLALGETAPARLAVAGRGGTLFAWTMA